MKNCWDYYKLLHVQPDAPTEIIRSSYRTLMLKLRQHPDKGGEQWNAALINQAYETLTDVEKRAKYDRELFGFSKADAARGVEVLKVEQMDRGSGFARYRRLESTPVFCCVFCRTAHGGNIHPNVERRCVCCRSPLNPVADNAPLNAEQRRAVRRMALHSRLTFYTDWPQAGFPGYVNDISPMGMQIHARERLKEHQVIKIESDILSAAAMVVYCRGEKGSEPPAYVIGIKFFTLLFRRSLGTFLSVTA